jgi:drug/metabolite transporter (DMT)-like permease
LLGDGLALTMAVSLSLMTVIARRGARPPALPTACIASLVAALAVVPLGWASGASFVIAWPAVAWLAAFGVMTMAIALPCYLSGAACVPAELPLAPLWVWLAFAEIPPNASLIGGGVVAFAVLRQMGAKE